MAAPRLIATYAVRADPASVDARAQTLALEQSVELPLAAVHDAAVREEVVARVDGIAPRGDRFEVRLALATATFGRDAGQLLNMLFGNSSLHDDVELVDVDLPGDLAATFGGPRFGIEGWRAATGAVGRPLTCSALKPLGLGPDALATLAGALARGGIDVIKDDHGLADQASAPFRERVAAVQRAIAAANRATGGRTIYAPSVTGDLDAMHAQAGFAREAGAGAILVAPMVGGMSSLAALARDAGVPILAHPSLAGVARIAPPLLLGKLFRLFGADATIFPNAGGRFGYSRETCAAIVRAARDPSPGLRPALPVPAGGMSVERVPAMRATFGDDAMLLIGGDLLAAGSALESRCRAFVAAVRESAEVA
ncbi:MAG: RuBisCO large subunit C-terminal-like domain-containing protein [Vicinamibacteria bacterium]